MVCAVCYNKDMKKIILAIIAIIFLAVAWYGLSPLWDTKMVNEALPTVDPETQTATQVPEMNQVQISEPVPIVDTAIHPGSGQVRIVKEGDKTFVRYENFKRLTAQTCMSIWRTISMPKTTWTLGLSKGRKVTSTTRYRQA